MNKEMPVPEPQPERGGINKPDLSTPLTDRLLAELQQEMDQPLSRERLEQILNPTELTNEQRDFIDQWKQVARAIAARRDKTPNGAG